MVKWTSPVTVSTGKSKTKRVREYSIWCGMVDRVKNPIKSSASYSDTSISEDFYNYDYFYIWCKENKYFNFVDENGSPYELDKDILGCGKLYSSDTCTFVPKKLNMFFSTQKKHSFDLPLGVSFSSKDSLYTSSIRDFDGNQVHLCQSKDISTCISAYITCKSFVAKVLAIRYYGQVDIRVIKILMNYEEYYYEKYKPKNGQYIYIQDRH